MAKKKRKSVPDRVPDKILITTALVGRVEQKPLHALVAGDTVTARFSKLRNRQHKYKVQADVSNGSLDLIKEED